MYLKKYFKQNGGGGGGGGDEVLCEGIFGFSYPWTPPISENLVQVVRCVNF